MEKITFTNSRGQTVELGEAAPYILTKIEGLGGVGTDVQTQKSPFQNGETYIGNQLEPRSLSMEITIVSNSEDDIVAKRRQLLQAFNPTLGEGTLLYEFGSLRREIKAISDSAPTFPDAGSFKTLQQPALIQLYCANPFWFEKAAHDEEMAEWVGGLTFPLRLPMTFASRSSKQSTVIRNDGDVETPVTFEFLGPAANPRITNETTGEYIQINREITADERLIVTTGFGNKTVILKEMTAGRESNAFNWIDLGSTFFQLGIGDNLISYNAGTSQKNAKVWVKWRNQYVGV